MFKHGDPVIDDYGNTGEIYGKERDGRIRVAYYNDVEKWVPLERLEYNDYADSEEEENDLRLSMGDDDYDRMHGDLGYKDDEDEYMEDLDRIRHLAGMPARQVEEDTRKMTNELHRMMDEGEIDPRAVADAALIYMSEDEVADMMHSSEFMPADSYDDDDGDYDDYDDSMSPEDNVRQVFDRSKIGR